MVLTELEAGRIAPEAAVTNLGLGPRQLRRLRKRFLAGGPVTLNHGNLGRQPWHAVDQKTKDLVVSIYLQPEYLGMNFHQFTEFLAERHGIILSRPVVHRILRAAGIAPPHPQRRRKRHRKRRERSAQEGYMLQLDASKHLWVEHLPEFAIPNATDDATSQICFLDRPTEDLWGYMFLLREICTTKGIPRVVYTDGLSAFGAKNTNSPHWKRNLAQLEKVLQLLGIQHITAGSPEAKGRVERTFLTLQDRLVSHLRADRVETMEEVRRSYRTYQRNHNLRFAKPPADPMPAWRPWPQELNPDEVFCLHHVRTVRNDNTIVFLGLVIDLPPGPKNSSLARQRVEVLKSYDGTLVVKQGQTRLALVLPVKAARTTKGGSKSKSRDLVSADRI